MTCMEVCSSDPDFYAYNHTTIGPLCVLYCPATYYRHSVTRHCVQNCPGPDYFRDERTMTCVEECSDHYYADTNGQVCVTDCGVSGWFALRNESRCVP